MARDFKGKELGAGIRQISENRYEGRYYDRFKNRKSVYAKTEKEIKKKLKEAIGIDLANKSIRKRIKLDQWYTEWMETYKKPFIRPSSKIYYDRSYSKHIAPVMGNMYLEDVLPIHVKSLMNSLEERGYKWETRNKIKILIEDMYRHAIDNNYATSIPTKGLKLPKEEDFERVVLTVEEQKIFFECSAGTFYNNMFVIQVNSGLRPGELFALELDDLDFEKHEIHVRETLSYAKWDGDEKRSFHLGDPKTKTSFRKVPMNHACEMALKRQILLKAVLNQRWPETGEFSKLICVTSMNHPVCVQNYNDAIKRIRHIINLQRDPLEQLPRFSGHSFRHTFATRCIEDGMKPKTLQKILGHKKLEMTMDLYVHVTEDFMHEEMEKFNEVVNSTEFDGTFKIGNMLKQCKG